MKFNITQYCTTDHQNKGKMLNWQKLLHTVWCCYNALNFLSNSHKIHHIARPFRARYGMSFMGPNSDLYFATVTAVMYAISCYIGLHYNSTRLYFVYMKEQRKHMTAKLIMLYARYVYSRNVGKRFYVMKTLNCLVAFLVSNEIHT